MDTDIEALKRQIIFAHERIERLTKENWEFRMLIRALMLSHENKAWLAREIEADKERALSIGLGEDIPDSDIHFFQDKADRAIALVLAQKRGEP